MMQPVLADATSGRSKCKACAYLGGGDPTIPIGSKRVGIPGHARGVTIYHYCHPSCFAKHCLRVDRAPTGRAKCKADGEAIEKGAIRLLIGYKKESTTYKVENAGRTIVPELVALLGRSKVTVHGLSELTLDERLRAEALIFSSGGAAAGITSATTQKTASGTKRGKPAARADRTDGPIAKKARKAKASSSSSGSSRASSRRGVADSEGNEDEEEEAGEACD
jgi:hypothetical protein